MAWRVADYCEQLVKLYYFIKELNCAIV